MAGQTALRIAQVSAQLAIYPGKGKGVQVTAQDGWPQTFLMGQPFVSCQRLNLGNAFPRQQAEVRVEYLNSYAADVDRYPQGTTGLQFGSA